MYLADPLASFTDCQSQSILSPRKFSVKPLSLLPERLPFEALQIESKYHGELTKLEQCEENERIYLSEHFSITKQKLGEGVSGIVFLGYRNVDDTKVAIKRIEPVNDRGEREARTQHSLNHPNICNFIAFFKDHEDTDTGVYFDYIVSEYIEGFTLKVLLESSNSMDGDRAEAILRGFYSAIKYLRGIDLYHNDITTSNVMVSASEDAVKIIDFGLAGKDRYPYGNDGARSLYIAQRILDASGADEERSERWIISFKEIFQ